jgi:hypothetical protein
VQVALHERTDAAQSAQLRGAGRELLEPLLDAGGRRPVRDERAEVEVVRVRPARRRAHDQDGVDLAQRPQKRRGGIGREPVRLRRKRRVPHGSRRNHARIMPRRHTPVTRMWQS